MAKVPKSHTIGFSIKYSTLGYIRPWHNMEQFYFSVLFSSPEPAIYLDCAKIEILGRSQFSACAEYSFCNFQPIRFVRFDNESVIRRLQVLEAARGLDPWRSPNGSRVLGTLKASVQLDVSTARLCQMTKANDLCIFSSHQDDTSIFICIFLNLGFGREWIFQWNLLN